METNQKRHQLRALRVSVIIALAIIILFGGAQHGLAQQPWSTPDPNNNNIYKTPTTGNVGIGTTSPNFPLEVKNSGYSPGINLIDSGTGKRATIGFGIDSGLTVGWAMGQDRNVNGTRDSYLYDVANNRDVIYGSNTGNVGIGMTNPQFKLDVNGSINVSGNINAKFQDVAEWVRSSEQLPTGTVVVLDSTKSNQVVASTVSYDTRVAGVISEQPGIALGERTANKVLVATTGRVRVKVDASRGPIHIGDLLVTSGIPGMAMKSEPVNLGGVQIHRPGTLIGKALEPLEKGSGEILVLLSLQ
jgi:hypothetical protein